MAAWLALPFFVLGAAGLTVDSESPDALCPPVEETRAAVAARLGSVELEGTWHASYVLVHRAQGDFVSLSLHDPNGALRLSRELPVQGGSCATLSRVIALMLERFFLRPEQTTPSEPPTESNTPPPAPAATPAANEPAADEPAHSLAAPPPPRDVATAPPPPHTQRFRVSANLWATTSWLAPSLRLERELSEHYGFGLNAGFDLSDHETQVFEGSARVRRLPISLLAERGFALSRSIDAYAGLELLGVVEDAHTSELAHSGGGLRVVPGLGARLGSRLFGQSLAQPFVELTAAWLLGMAAPAFRVGDEEILVPKALVFGLALGIGTPF